MRTQVQISTLTVGSTFFLTETDTDECTLVTKQKICQYTNSAYPPPGPPYGEIGGTAQVWID